MYAQMILWFLDPDLLKLTDYLGMRSLELSGMRSSWISLMEAEDKSRCRIYYQGFWHIHGVGVIARAEGRTESWRKACIFTYRAI